LQTASFNCPAAELERPKMTISDAKERCELKFQFGFYFSREGINFGDFGNKTNMMTSVKMSVENLIYKEEKKADPQIKINLFNLFCKQ